MDEIFDKIVALRELCDKTADEKNREFYEGVLDVLDDLADAVDTILLYAEEAYEDEDEYEDDYSEEEYTYSVVCPSCGHEIEDIGEDDTQIKCPACGNSIVLSDDIE